MLDKGRMAFKTCGLKEWKHDEGKEFQADCWCYQGFVASFC